MIRTPVYAVYSNVNMEVIMFKEAEQNGQVEHWNACLESVARSGDKAMFMLFYDHFAPRLNSWLLGSTRDPALAEELVQETMLSVWRKAGQYDSSKAAASTWLFRIARNIHIDYLRRAKVRDRSSAMMMADEAPLQDPDSADESRVRDAVRQLPVQQAQVVYKSYFEGKSHQQIADEMDLPLGSVKSSLRLAFQKLTKVLRPQP